MKIMLAIILMFMSCSALAESFEQRVEIAKSVEQSKEYKNYEKTMFDSVGNYMASAMNECFAILKNPNTRKFVFVANIGRHGETLDIDTKPKTNISECFSSKMSKAVFAVPPKLDGRDVFPIFIKMRITP